MKPSRPTIGGYSYDVSDEQLAAFAELTPLERLQWVEQARLFTLLGQTVVTRKRQENLRQGKMIDED